VQGLGSTWGFEGVAQQITQTALLFSGGINIYFLGITNQKDITEKEKNYQSLLQKSKTRQQKSENDKKTTR
jgi:hypothetical protein